MRRQVLYILRKQIEANDDFTVNELILRVGGREGEDKAWDREAMFLQLARRFSPYLVK